MPGVLYSGLNYKVVKDPVHTSIELPSSFFHLIDDPLFQRLRYIKQTGLTHYVYPGLRHTRFEHSLGVAHLMLTSLEWIARNTRSVYGDYDEVSRVARKLVEEPLYWCASGIAALLHDIGHLTWSHVFESALRDANVLFAARRRENYGSLVSLRRHEELTLLASNVLLEKHAENVCKELYNYIDVASLHSTVLSILRLAYFPEGLNTRYENSDEELRILYIPARLLSGTIDVDRGDYLLRDSRSAGVSYGLYDLDRLIRVLVLAERDDGMYDIGIVDKGVSVVENMLLGRMYMYTEVYMHDVVLSYEASASRLLSLLILLSLEYSEKFSQNHGFEDRLLGCLATIVQLDVQGDVEGEAKDKLEKCMRLVTDPPIETLVEMLANDELFYSTIIPKLEDGKWMCPALRIYSKVLTSRRHPPSLYLSPEEARLLLGFLDSENASNYANKVEDTLKPYIEHLAENPLIVLSHINPKVYNPKDPVRVVRRETRRVYRLEDVGASVVAKLLSAIGSRAKVVIALPYLPSNVRPPLRARRGKLDEDTVVKAFVRCGYSEKEARENLEAMRRALDEIIGAITDVTHV